MSKYLDGKSKEERFCAYKEKITPEWKNFCKVLLYCKDHNRYEDIKNLWFNRLNNYTNICGEWNSRISWLKWIQDQAATRRDDKARIKAMVYRARTLLLQSRPEKLKKAYEFLDKAWIQKDCLEFRMQDYIANHLAGVCIRLGRYSEAHQWLNEEENLLGKSNLEQDQVSKFQTYIKRERAEIYLNEGKLDEAESLCQFIISEVEESRAQNYANHLLAKIIIAQEDETRYEEARRYLLSGLEEVEIHQDKRRIAYYHATLAELGYLMDPVDLDSRRYAEKAYKIFQDLDMFQEKNSMQSLLSKVPSNLSLLSNKLQQRLKNSQIVVMCLDCIKFHMNSVTAFYTESVS